ncbi:hypothetical protein [Plantibacter sp. YIM 135249]|uniref:hypothetical protein n=1 Tax=Plantibacter sp. YIM 135249 TaxID=3423918 RepID=UPI003D32F7BD
MSERTMTPDASRQITELARATLNGSVQLAARLVFARFFAVLALTALTVNTWGTFWAGIYLVLAISWTIDLALGISDYNKLMAARDAFQTEVDKLTKARYV